MDIADLGNGKAVQRLRKIGDRHVDANHARGAPRVDEAPQRDDACKRHGGHRRRRLQSGRLERAGTQRIDRRRCQQRHVATDGGDKQRREQAHGDQAGPGQRRRRRLARTAPQAMGHQQPRSQQQQAQPPSARRTERRRQAQGDIQMKQEKEQAQHVRRSRVFGGRQGTYACAAPFFKPDPWRGAAAACVVREAENRKRKRQPQGWRELRSVGCEGPQRLSEAGAPLEQSEPQLVNAEWHSSRGPLWKIRTARISASAVGLVSGCFREIGEDGRKNSGHLAATNRNRMVDSKHYHPRGSRNAPGLRLLRTDAGARVTARLGRWLMFLGWRSMALT